MIAFDLFRPRLDLELWCAVPEGTQAPDFLRAGGWSFSCKLDRREPLPTGFDLKAALAGIRFNGFYLFENFGHA